MYTQTVAQLSANEVQGILVLSDVRGIRHADTVVLCKKIAFECQPCAVLAPNLFRGEPWNDNDNNKDNNYEDVSLFKVTTFIFSEMDNPYLYSTHNSGKKYVGKGTADLRHYNLAYDECYIYRFNV